MLAIARALASEPQALLLDEPSMGLAPKLVDEIFAIIAEERARGTSILLVEQNARRALALADRAYVMERGRIVLERHRRGARDPPRRHRRVPRRVRSVRGSGGLR